MNSFRIFIAEQSKINEKQWFENIPMPEMVGNALMVANQHVLNLKKGINESYNDVQSGRGFPFNQGFVNAFSIVPISLKSKENEPEVKSKKVKPSSISQVGGMIYAFDWLINQGLFEALQIRKKMAKKATDDFIRELGLSGFEKLFKTGKQTGRENIITEDMVYSAKAHQEIPELRKWFEQIPKKDLEPKSLIKIPTSKDDYHRISLEDINNVISMLNQSHKKIKLETFHYSGPNGFIEWIEDGPWAEKIGTIDEIQPWRTKHGVSLHEPKVTKDEKTGQIAYQFGGIISPLRNMEGPYQIFIRRHIQAILVETSRAVQDKIKNENLTKEESEWIDQLKELYNNNSYIKYNTSFSNSQGYELRTSPEFNDPVDFAVHLVLIRAEIGLRADVNDAIDRGENEKSIIEKLHIPQTRFKNIRDGKADNKVTSKNINSFYGIFGVEKGKNFWKTGQAIIKKGNADLQAYTFFNNGANYLKELSKHLQLSTIIDKYIDPEEYENLNLDSQDILKTLAQALKESLASSDNIAFPKLDVDLKTEFGDVVKDFKPLNKDQLENLKAQGYVFRPDKKNQEIDQSISGKMTNAYNTIVLKRKDINSNWTALDTDDLIPTDQRVKRYSNEVPLLIPGSSTYGGGRTTASKAGIGHDLKKLSQEVESNPKDFGYGIDGIPDTMYKHMLEKAYQMIKNSDSVDKNYDKPFSGRDPDSLAYSLVSVALEKSSGLVFKYGNITDKKFIDDYLKNPTRGKLAKKSRGDLPELNDSKQIDAWVNYMNKIIKSGETVKPLPYDDLDPENYENGEMPVLIHNAFLAAGASYRRQLATNYLRTLEKSNDLERQAPQSKNKEGDETSIDFADSDDKQADRMKTHKGLSDTLANRIGYKKDTGIDGSDSIEINNMIKTPTRNLRNKENDYTYVYIYNQNYSNLKNADVKDIARELKTIILNKEVLNSKTQGKIDAITDVLYKQISDRRLEFFRVSNPENRFALISQYFNDLYIHGVDLLIRAYEVIGDNINIKEIIYEAAGDLNEMIKNSLKKAKQKPQVEDPKPTGQQASHYSSEDEQEQPRLAAQNPVAAPPATTPNIKISYGLNVKKPFKEWYSFRTRYLKKRI